MPKISAIVITKNEEHMIANCLDTLRWCDEILVVDDHSTDGTVTIAERAGAHVFTVKSSSFANSRNVGLKHAKGDWVLYVDADERVTPALKKEILSVLSGPQFVAYALKRNNIHYGKWMQRGGWEKDALIRLFEKSKLKTWAGEVHEHAEVEGEIGLLREPLVHLTHRNMRDGLEKSIVWTDIEANLLYASGHRKIGAWTLIKVTLQEFLRRVFVDRAYKDGMEGMVEAMVQAMNRFLVYERLWELQRKPSLQDTYLQIEKEIAKLWSKDA